MNIIPMMTEVLSLANPMIGKSSLPHFRIAADKCPELMRIPALDQLHRPLNRHVLCGSEHEMNVIGHNNELVQGVMPLAPIVIKSFEK